MICSMTSIELAIPPAQKAFQTLSILDRSSPVSIPVPQIRVNLDGGGPGGKAHDTAREKLLVDVLYPLLSLMGASPERPALTSAPPASEIL